VQVDKHLKNAYIPSLSRYFKFCLFSTLSQSSTLSINSLDICVSCCDVVKIR
jgi:hypothetical protein